MKKVVLLAALFAMSAVFLANANYFTGHVIQVPEEPAGKAVLGFCPTMRWDAESLATTEGYSPVEFGSASDALLALKNGQADMALIGRKAKAGEISGARETVLRTGYTLVSNRKGFVDRSGLHSMEAHTSAPAGVAASLLPGAEIVYHGTSSDAIGQAYAGKIALVTWEDWKDGLELVVVMDGSGKAAEFRGAFLYSA